MKKIIILLIVTLLFMSCGEEIKENGNLCPKDYHFEKETKKCIHDPVDCSSKPGTFDDGDGGCITPCKDVECGVGGVCEAEAIDKYSCKCDLPNVLGEDKKCHAPANFTDNKCHEEIYVVLSPQDKIADTTASISCEGDICTAIIDAKAGGYQLQKENPWIYISLKDNKKVALTDSAAFNSLKWDLALKRTIIRTNSEDSGVGNILVAKVNGLSFDDTTEVPNVLHQDFTGDKFMDSGCGIIAGTNMSFIKTAFDNWFDMDSSQGKPKLSPKNSLYFVKSGDLTYKLQITEYDNSKDNDGESKSIYTIKYAPLK